MSTKFSLIKPTMQIKKTNLDYIAITSATPTTLNCDWFSESFWRNHNAIVGSSTGRYITWFVQQDSEQWVLRHYYRGGLVGKLIKDTYLYTGITRTRAVAEFTLLEQLFKEGFAVPEPVAAHVQRVGLCYRANIILKRIEGAHDLVAQLQQQSMTRIQWQQLGRCIATFHQRGVFHADLNAKNILITPKNFYLIDFDRGELRTARTKWQQANMSRLLRSFNKEKSKFANFHFSDTDWQYLLQGYRQQLTTQPESC